MSLSDLLFVGVLGPPVWILVTLLRGCLMRKKRFD